jgi:hypothetical protein
MVTAAKRAYGTILKRNGNAIGELTSIGGIEITADFEDVTTHQSTAAFREKIMTVLDAGNIPCEGNFIPGDTLGQIGLMTDQAAGTLQTFTIEFPGISSTFAFSALVTKWALPPMEVDGTQKFEAELEISGQPTLSITLSTGLTTPFFTVSGAGTLIVPAAAGAVYEYVADIATGVSSVTITPTATAGVITITANGVSQVVVSGNPSTAITLGSAGSIVTAVISVKETGKVAKEYTVHLTRASA